MEVPPQHCRHIFSEQSATDLMLELILHGYGTVSSLAKAAETKKRGAPGRGSQPKLKGSLPPTSADRRLSTLRVRINEYARCF